MHRNLRRRTTPTTFTGSLGGTGGTGCSTTSTATVDTTASTINVTAYASVGHFILNGKHYVATITRTASTSGTYSGGSFASALSLSES